jgi:HSP90 family molecular chaperone
LTKDNRNYLRLNLKLKGEPVKWLTEWKIRGIVSSYSDAVLQGLVVLRERIVEQDLKASKLQDQEEMQ